MTTISLARRLHIPPASDPWGRTLRRAGIVYLLSRLFVIMGAAIDMENRQQIMASFSDDARETQRAKREGRPPHYRS